MIDSFETENEVVAVMEADVHINASSKESVPAAGQDYEPDVRSAIGASVRKLSRVSQEPGFKEEDVKDFQMYGPVPLEDRKDSMQGHHTRQLGHSLQGSTPALAAPRHATLHPCRAVTWPGRPH
ncbi:hypothetical protein O3P69_011850 [Scylla paramamosain]|uniref:Uncharacterized protein n=1 Tax=Scylla paramamosain TaxID=85552 RepID=A0AAW0S9B0_SCYPA